MHINVISLRFWRCATFPYDAVVFKTITTVRKRNNAKRTNRAFVFPHKTTSSQNLDSGAATSCKAIIARRGETNNSTVERRKEDE
nr:MAG TPA: hypothetical protein [Caudoviricetes sp.]